MTVDYEVGGEAKRLRAEGFALGEALSLIPEEGSLLGVDWE